MLYRLSYRGHGILSDLKQWRSDQDLLKLFRGHPEGIHQLVLGHVDGSRDLSVGDELIRVPDVDDDDAAASAVQLEELEKHSRLERGQCWLNHR